MESRSIHLAASHNHQLSSSLTLLKLTVSVISEFAAERSDNSCQRRCHDHKQWHGTVHERMRGLDAKVDKLSIPNEKRRRSTTLLRSKPADYLSVGPETAEVLNQIS